MAEVSRIYSGFRGADFRGEGISLARSPDCLNMWKDYKETESIRTRPDIQLKESFDGKVYGIFFYNDMLIVHSGTELYKIENGQRSLLFPEVNEIKSNSFIYDGIWYFKDGKNYLQFDGTTIKEVEGFIPTTSLACNPDGSGGEHQDVNLLSDYRINTFVADGSSKEYCLDTEDIDTDYLPVVTHDSEEYSSSRYTVDYKLGKITFTTAPKHIGTDGQADLSIKFKKKVDGYSDRIKKCRLLQVFDNRVFFSGNDDFPNMLWHCSLNDPSYCSDTDYYSEGLDSAAVKGLVAGNNALWVFREPSQSNTNVFYHTPTIDSEYGKIYPSVHSSVSTGCIGAAVNFNDDIVFFSGRGMEGISGDITTEQAVAHRSSLIDSKLLPKTEEERSAYKNMLLAEWEGYLLVFIDNKVYLADSRATFSNENHFEYEWFYWELSKNITCVQVKDNVLYLGASDGVYTLTALDGAIKSYWVTAKDKFEYPNRLKTTNKRGCVAETTGDVSVFVKLEDTDFELIGEHKGINDHFISRIKRKKFKDIQLKFYSDTRFSLETVTLECFIGGYIKR